MDSKPWYKSTGVWSNIATGLLGIYLSLVTGGASLPSIPPWIVTILSGLGLYGRVSATTKIEKL